MNEKAKKSVQESIKKILQMFQTEELPQMIARTVIRMKKNCQIPSDKWSLGNHLIMYAHNTEDARGFKQWHQVNRTVKKGAKAFYILGPRMVKTKDESEIEEDGTPKKIFTGVTYIPVFPYESTEGEDIEYPDYTPKELPPLWDVAEKMGIKVSYKAFTGREYGHFAFQSNKIVLKTHDAKTYFHELGHAAHNTFKKLKGGQVPEQEIVAETVACVLCEMYGYEGYISHNFEYIKSYAGAKDGARVALSVLGVIGDVERCLNIILSTAERIQTA